MNKFYYVNGATTDFDLPTRSTKGSCGYDFHSPCDFEVLPHQYSFIKLNVKCKINDGEFIAIAIRSSLGINKHITLANNLGIIDQDYFNNSSNDGNIGISLYNNSDETFFVHKNDRIAQGIFIKYDLVDGDNTEEKRLGGYGSTGK